MIEVTTFEELLEAIQSEDTEINIMKDLDGNDKPFTEQFNPTITNDKTINGNGFTIFNITTEVVVNSTLIKGSKVIKFVNTNFYNLFRNEKYPFFGSNIHFEKCNFQGRGYCLFESGNINECAINFEISGGGYISNGNLTANFTYFSIKTPESDTSLNYLICRNPYFNSCYITGVISGNNRNIFNVNNSNCTFENGIINIRCTKKDENDETLFININNGQYYITDANNISVYNSDYVTKGKSYLTDVTDIELHNAQSLYDKGFNIIVT